MVWMGCGPRRKASVPFAPVNWAGRWACVFVVGSGVLSVSVLASVSSELFGLLIGVVLSTGEGRAFSIDMVWWSEWHGSGLLSRVWCVRLSRLAVWWAESRFIRGRIPVLALGGVLVCLYVLVLCLVGGR